MRKMLCVFSGLIMIMSAVFLHGCGGGSSLISSIPDLSNAMNNDASKWGTTWDDWSDGWTEKRVNPKRVPERVAAQEEEEDPFGNIMETTFSTIDSVSFVTPGAGQSTTVQAVITHDDDPDYPASIRSVKLIYRVNGGNRFAVNMTDNGQGNWSGVIPGTAKGVNVEFYIWICDTNGNVTTGAFPSSEVFVSGIRDMNNSSDLVKGDADLLRFSASYDNDNLYVGYEVESEITGGTIEPPYIMFYYIKITNPDIHQGEGLMYGIQWLFLPLYKVPVLHDIYGSFLNESGMNAYDPFKNMDEYPAAEPEGVVKDNGTVFVGRVKREALGENPSGYFRLIALTSVNESMDSFMPSPLNCTNFLSIYTSNYSYIVK